MNAEENDFWQGAKEQKKISCIFSLMLHGRGYVYMDTRQLNRNNDYKIYLYIETDEQMRYVEVQSYIDGCVALLDLHTKSK